MSKSIGRNEEESTNKKREEREGNHIESVERCDEEESDNEMIQIQNQELDCNEKCHCSYDCLIGMKLFTLFYPYFVVYL
jgi:hypothetical protein